MEWILIVVMIFGSTVKGGGSVSMQNFESEAACEFAMKTFIKNERKTRRAKFWSSGYTNWADCVPKGEVD